MNDLNMHPAARQFLENHPFPEMQIGDEARAVRVITRHDVHLFGAMSGDVSPALAKARGGRGPEHSVSGMLGSSLIAAVIGTRLPGPGTVQVAQHLKFPQPIRIGDTLHISVTVKGLEPRTRHVTLAVHCADQHGVTLIEGEVEVVAPPEKLHLVQDVPADPEPDAVENGHADLLAAAHKCPPMRMAVVHPCSPDSLKGAVDAARHRLIEAVLIGPEARIRSLAAEHRLSLEGIEIVDVQHSHAAASRAVEMARTGQVAGLMKGSLHTDELLSEVVRRDSGLRTSRRISHVFVLDVPRYPKPLLITDAAINVAPDFDAKVDIVQNAIDLALSLGIAKPKVAVLSAVETVTPKLRSAMDAAALAKMADRGQITGGLVDGPLAFDNAISMEAAKNKGITSLVAGDADILVVSDLESGNMLAKQLEYLGGAHTAGVVMGAKVPIVLTSRSDSAHARVASCGIALLWNQYKRAKS